MVFHPKKFLGKMFCSTNLIGDAVGWLTHVRHKRSFRQSIFTLASYIILCTGICYSNCNRVSAKDFSINIIHTNDSHGTVEHEPYVKALADETRKAGKNVLIMSAGDVLHGQVVANLSRGLSVAKIMDAVGYDYICPGNHDFNYGLSELKNLSTSHKFQMLSANILDEKKGYVFKPYDIKEMDGVKIGIFGLTTPETPTKTSGMHSIVDLTFENPVTIAKKIVKELKDAGCQIIIAVTHLGLDRSQPLDSQSDTVAKEVEGIDLIIDGHSHTELEEGMQVGKTLIVQTGERGKNIGLVNIEMKDNKLTKIAKLVNLTESKDIKPDKRISKMIQLENDKVIESMSQKICKIDFDLDGKREDVRQHDTNLTDLATDAMLYATKADLALMTGGTVRNSIEAGTVTELDIFTALPFSNVLITQRVTGKAILEALEHGVSQYPESFGGMVHVSGIKFKFDPNEKPGNRVFDVYFENTNEKLDVNKTYTIAMSKFTLQNGDGYTAFSEKDEHKEYGTLEEVTCELMKTSTNLERYRKVQNRIAIQQKTNQVYNLYTVKKGDCLWNLARKFKTTWQYLAKINSIKNPDLIYPGQKLKLS